MLSQKDKRSYKQFFYFLYLFVHSTIQCNIAHVMMTSRFIINIRVFYVAVVFNRQTCLKKANAHKHVCFHQTVSHNLET